MRKIILWGGAIAAAGIVACGSSSDEVNAVDAGSGSSGTDAGVQDGASESSTTDSGTTPTNIPIHHVVVIVKENHTFDNYFGTFPGAEGTSICKTSTGNIACPHAP